ncbi:MAG: hypothetical protein JSS28_12735 [Proteobacteria bacterium]|nr:hypothetical protein [Pseudomonadota bacterium]
MQRWLKLPDGRYLDANSVVYVGKVETYPRLDENGDEAGQGYAVSLGTDIPREHHVSVMGTKDEVLALLKALLGGTAAA